MKKGIIGKKIGMTQIFEENGAMVPVTLVQAGPCVVVQKKTKDRDGYLAVKLGFEDIPERKLNRPDKGQFKAAGVGFKRHLKEFRLEGADALNVGDTVSADQFAPGERVDVTGTSKGHGFTGVIKRWNFSRLRMSHGTGPVARHGGSLGANTTPARIVKNKKMAGHYGHEQVTVLNLTVVKVDAERGIIALRGAVPGARNGIVFLRETVRA